MTSETAMGGTLRYPARVFAGWDLPRETVLFLRDSGLPRQVEDWFVFGFASGELFAPERGGDSSLQDVTDIFPLYPRRSIAVIGGFIDSADVIGIRVVDGAIVVADESGRAPRFMNTSVTHLAHCLDAFASALGEWNSDEDGERTFAAIVALDPELRHRANTWRDLLVGAARGRHAE